MDTTLITSTAAVLALGAWAFAECRARVWKKMTFDGIKLLQQWRERHSEAMGVALGYLAERDALLEASLDARLARRKELRLKRSQAALKGHQTRRQANG